MNYFSINFRDKAKDRLPSCEIQLIRNIFSDPFYSKNRNLVQTELIRFPRS